MGVGVSVRADGEWSVEQGDGAGTYAAVRVAAAVKRKCKAQKRVCAYLIYLTNSHTPHATPTQPLTTDTLTLS